MPTQNPEVLFAEEQSFRQPWLWALMVGVFLILVFGLGLVIFKAPDEDGRGQAILGLSLGIAVQLGVTVLMYVMKLTVRLDADGLHVRFFPLVKRNIPLGEIARWEARTYRPILEYGGWGIRCGWKGMAYNVSGNRGVQLVLANGKRLLIGSQRPEELAAVISRATGRDG